MKWGIVGATGLVGQSFLRLLEEANLSFQELRLFSRRERACSFKGQKIKSQSLKEGCFKDLDLCFFSAGKKISAIWAPQAVKAGAIAIDNSSAFRSDPDKLLAVPEVNGRLLGYKPQIISNPNCSAIQLALPLHALHKAFGLKSVHVASLQSISGAGKQALEDLKRESRAVLEGKEPYEREDISSAFNCVPYIGETDANGFCEEEIKIMTESRKILNLPDLKISAWAVRVPSLNSHSQIVRCSFKKSPGSKKEMEKALSAYVQLLNPPPHARQASGKKGVFAGRVHKDSLGDSDWLLWVVADNLLKGASLNGLEIAKKLMEIKNSRKNN